MRKQPESFEEEQRPEKNGMYENTFEYIKQHEIRRKIEKGSTYFTKEFNRYFKTFVTGAFSFVAALLWRDAISMSINEEGVQGFFSSLMPFIGETGLMYITAFVVTIAAVFAIIVINRSFKTD